MTKPVTARELLDGQWKRLVKLATALPHMHLSEEYTESHNLLNLLDRKLKAVMTIANVIHVRGDEYTVTTFEGTLLGGLNDYQIDVPFDNSPSTRMQVANLVLVRLTMLRRFLTMAFDYFTIDGKDSPLYESFVGSVYPSLMDWVHTQSEYLTES